MEYSVVTTEELQDCLTSRLLGMRSRLNWKRARGAELLLCLECCASFYYISASLFPPFLRLVWGRLCTKRMQYKAQRSAGTRQLWLGPAPAPSGLSPGSGGRGRHLAGSGGAGAAPASRRPGDSPRETPQPGSPLSPESLNRVQANSTPSNEYSVSMQEIKCKIAV